MDPLTMRQPFVAQEDVASARVLTLEGDHDLATAPALRHAIDAALDERRGVVIELSLSSFIDSAVFGAIVRGRRRAEASGLGYGLVVSRTTGGVKRFLQATGLLWAFPVHTSRDEAIAAVAAGVNRADW
jgi:anti-anti-sigma factor